MNKSTQLLLNVILLLTMLTHGSHAVAENPNERFLAISGPSITLNEGQRIPAETRPPGNEAADMALFACAAAETSIPLPLADPDRPIAIDLLLVSPALFNLIPLIAVHEPPTYPPDVHRAFLQVFRN